MSVSVRYMGTKSHLAPKVRNVLEGISTPGPIADLFSGMGSVARCLAPTYPVITSDQLAFTACFARVQLLDRRRSDLATLRREIGPRYRSHLRLLNDVFSRRLLQERRALNGSWPDLRLWMLTAPHVGTSETYARRARSAALANTRKDRYCLATLYFSASYFSTEQAIALDSLRGAIDNVSRVSDREWLIAAWLATAGRIINAPGHTAQFLTPHNKTTFARISRLWRRKVWDVFWQQALAMNPVGTARWRRMNAVLVGDSLKLLRTGRLKEAQVIYADPPYTRDQYSRYYHVYETLFSYDFPVSTGYGRYRGDRFTTPFSVLGKCEAAFDELFRLCAENGSTLLLSYPSNGLLSRAGAKVTDLLEMHLRVREKLMFTPSFSTLGASKGSSRKRTREHLYVCSPK